MLHVQALLLSLLDCALTIASWLSSACSVALCPAGPFLSVTSLLYKFVLSATFLLYTRSHISISYAHLLKCQEAIPISVKELEIPENQHFWCKHAALTRVLCNVDLACSRASKATSLLHCMVCPEQIAWTKHVRLVHSTCHWTNTSKQRQHTWHAQPVD